MKIINKNRLKHEKQNKIKDQVYFLIIYNLIKIIYIYIISYVLV